MTTATATKTRIICPLCKRKATIQNMGDKARGFTWYVIPYDQFYACNNAINGIHAYVDVTQQAVGEAKKI